MSQNAKFTKSKFVYHIESNVLPSGIGDIVIFIIDPENFENEEHTNRFFTECVDFNVAELRKILQFNVPRLKDWKAVRRLLDSLEDFYSMEPSGEETIEYENFRKHEAEKE